MREEYQFSSDEVEDDVLPEAPSQLVLWVWPVLGSLSIAAIVAMILLSPELSSKLGVPGFSTQKPQVVVNLTTLEHKTVTQKPQVAESKAKPDVGNMKPRGDKSASMTPTSINKDDMHDSQSMKCTA